MPGWPSNGLPGAPPWPAVAPPPPSSSTWRCYSATKAPSAAPAHLHPPGTNISNRFLPILFFPDHPAWLPVTDGAGAGRAAVHPQSVRAAPGWLQDGGRQQKQVLCWSPTRRLHSNGLRAVLASRKVLSPAYLCASPKSRSHRDTLNSYVLSCTHRYVCTVHTS